ncbi:MAG: hypothetical protein Q9192_006552 [Flavoplaca navasiana]
MRISRKNERKGLTTIIFRPTAWALLWNGLGAGWILPLAIYFHLQPPASTSLARPIPMTHAKALIPTMIIGSYLTAITMFHSPTLTTSPTQHQAMIVVFQLAPLFTTIVQMTLASLISRFAPPSSSSAVSLTKATQQDSGFPVKLSLLLSTAFLASIHIYCLLSIIFSSSPSSSFSYIYVPSPTTVHPSSTHHIAQGALLFMQYDNIVISLTCALLCYVAVRPCLDLGRKGSLGLAIEIAAATVLVGPGAVVSAGFAWRERRGRWNAMRGKMGAKGKGVGKIEK